MQPGSGRARRALMALLLCLMLALTVAVPRARSERQSMIQIQEAIAEQGLGWQPVEYDREFALGAMIRNQDRAAPDDRPGVSAVSLSKASPLPASLDWREGGWVSPVKDQGRCGACYAFAAVGALESLLAMSAGTPATFLDLSESIVAFCPNMTYSPGGCLGAYMDETAQHMLETGTYTEACFPYTLDGAGYLTSPQECSFACSGWRDNAYRTAAYTPVAQSVAALKSALQHGPFAVGFDVYADFYTYGSGVYEYATGAWEGGHAVLLVGYTDTPGLYGGGYFIAKNSWGEDWGEGGFFRIGYSTVSGVVDFGIDAFLYLLTDPTDAYEPDDARYQSTALTSGEEQAHSLFPTGDSDWYTFTLDSPSWVVFSTEGPEGGDTVAGLYDAGSPLNLLSEDDDSGDGRYSRIEAALGAGTYYLRVSSYNDYDILPAYTATLTAGQPAPPSFATREVWFDLPAYDRPSQNAWPRFAADVNGDGMADSVLFHSTRGIKVSLSDGSQFNLDGWWSTYKAFNRTNQNKFPRFLADVNGDGRDDVVLFHPTKGVKVALSNGSRFVMDGWWSAAPVFMHTSQDIYPRHLADVNGDGKADAVILHPTKGVKVALSNGQRFGQPMWWNQDAALMRDSQDAYPRFLADVNGDDMADIALFHPTRGIKVALSNGHRFGTPEWWHDGFQGDSLDAMPRALGDVNGDGVADAVLFEPGGMVRVAVSDGTAFGPLRIWGLGFGHGTQDAYPRSLADCTGDGAADAVLFTPSSGVQVAAATTE